VVGILTETLLSGRLVKAGQIVIYLSMGWLCALDIAGLKAALPGAGFYWLLTGGLSYTFGVTFYATDKLKWFSYSHGIWHFFVLAGSIAHFITVIGYVR
ncbi:MAG: PAQR family membrane homeostasis protein TrhA, partial [Anaerolineales bacterium]